MKNKRANRKRFSECKFGKKPKTLKWNQMVENTKIHFDRYENKEKQKNTNDK